MKLLIKNVVLPEGDGLKTTDIAIADGIIAKIGKADAEFVADEIIEGNNRLAIPAFVNAHTHMYMSRFAMRRTTFLLWNGSSTALCRRRTGLIASRHTGARSFPAPK